MVVNDGNDSLAFFAGEGNGAFAPAVLTELSLPFANLATGDFNGDGKPDLVGYSGVSLQILLGNGSGGFSPGASILQGPVAGFSAADLNGDGLTDLVVTTDENTLGVLSVYLNEGGGAFQQTSYSLPAFRPSAPIVVDLNGDGIPDLILLGQPNSYVLFGEGGGVFAGMSPLAVEELFGVAADFNGDGFPDLAVSGETDFKVLLGDGKGSFAFPGNPDGLWLAPAGMVEIATANLQSQRLRVRVCGSDWTGS